MPSRDIGPKREWHALTDEEDARFAGIVAVEAGSWGGGNRKINNLGLGQDFKGAMYELSERGGASADDIRRTLGFGALDGIHTPAMKKAMDRERFKSNLMTSLGIGGRHTGDDVVASRVHAKERMDWERENDLRQ